MGIKPDNFTLERIEILKKDKDGNYTKKILWNKNM